MGNQDNAQKRREELDKLDKLFEEFQWLEQAGPGDSGMFGDNLIAPYSHGKAPTPSTWTTSENDKK